MKIIITIIAIIIFILAMVRVANSGVSIEKINAFEDCILDQYDMSSTDYYSLTGTQPICK